LMCLVREGLGFFLVYKSENIVPPLSKKKDGGGGGGDGIVLKSNKREGTAFFIFPAEIYYLL